MSGTNDPLVSILIPAYNAAPYLAETLDSLIQQTYQNFEVVLVIDGKSKDNTLEIAKTYSSRLKLKIIDQKVPDSNASRNRNLAFNYAQGELIKFLDADDILSPEHLANQVATLQKHPDSIAIGECWRFFGNKLNKNLLQSSDNWSELTPIDWLIFEEGRGFGMMQPGMFLIPRTILDLSGLWDENLTLIDDFEFFPRVLIKVPKVFLCKGAKLYYRSGNAATLSTQTSGVHLLSAYNALSKTTNLVLLKENSPRVKRILAFYWRLWSYNFYPTQLELYKKSERVIQELGGYPLIDQGGLTSQFSRILGWKTVKWLKLITTKLRLDAHRHHG